MNGQIPWWQSRTIWFGLAQALIGVAVAFGVVTGEQASQALGYFEQLLGVVITALAVGQVQGRWTATKEIKSAVVPTGNPSEPTGAP